MFLNIFGKISSGMQKGRNMDTKWWKMLRKYQFKILKENTNAKIEKIPIHNSWVVRSIHLGRGEAAGTWMGERILKGALPTKALPAKSFIISSSLPTKALPTAPKIILNL